MELNQLEYFRVLCKYGSYTSASQELCVSQPAVSMAVRKLEEECSGPLIDRRSKSFALTEKGEILLKWAVIIRNDLDGMYRDMDSLSLRAREIIRLALPLPLCPEITSVVLPRFTSEHTDTALHLMQEGHSSIAAGLLSRTIDIGIICKDLIQPMLESVDYKKVEYYACLPPEHPLSGAEVLTPEQLAGETLLISKASNSISKSIIEYFSRSKIKPHLAFEEVYPDDIWQLSKQGKGVSFMPSHVCTENARPLSPGLYSDLVIAWRKGETLTQKKREFIDCILSAAPVTDGQ